MLDLEDVFELISDSPDDGSPAQLGEEVNTMSDQKLLSQGLGEVTLVAKVFLKTKASEADNLTKG